MTEEEIRKVCNYIKTHRPQVTEFETVNVAIMAVTKDRYAATREDLLGDDVWLIPVEERDKLAGVRGKGWCQTLSEEIINMFLEAVEYAKTHAKEYGKSTMDDDIEILKQMRNDLISSANYNAYSNIDNKNDYSPFTEDNNINKMDR